MPTRSSAGGCYGEKKEKAEESQSAREASGVNFIIRTVQDHDDTRHFISCLVPEIQGQKTHFTPLNDFSSSHKEDETRLNLLFVCHLLYFLFYLISSVLEFSFICLICFYGFTLNLFHLTLYSRSEFSVLCCFFMSYYDCVFSVKHFVTLSAAPTKFYLTLFIIKTVWSDKILKALLFLKGPTLFKISLTDIFLDKICVSSLNP